MRADVCIVQGYFALRGWWLDVGDDKTDEEIDDGLKRQDKPALCSGRQPSFSRGSTSCLWARPGRSLGVLEDASQYRRQCLIENMNVICEISEFIAFFLGEGIGQ